MRFSVNTSVLLWIVQGFLALFFALGSGAPKLLLPFEMLPLPLPLPELFVRLIGVAEVLGAIGLILPSVLRLRPSLARLAPSGLASLAATGLAPLAASGLVLLTICATVYQLLARQPESAVFAAVMCLLCAFVAYGRWRLAPLTSSSLRLPVAAVA